MFRLLSLVLIPRIYGDLLVTSLPKGPPEIHPSQTYTNMMDCFGDLEMDMTDSEFCLHSVAHVSRGNPGIEDLIVGVNETMITCKVMGGEKILKRGCESLTKLSFDLLSMSLGYLILCGSDDDNFHQNVVQFPSEAEPIGCQPFVNLVANQFRARMEQAEERYYFSPLKYFVSDQISKWKTTFIEALLQYQNNKEKNPEAIIRPSALWRNALDCINDITQWVRWNAWQSSHFTWIQDTIQAKKVVHTEWGPGHRWNALGANDANNTYELPGWAPKFVFSDKFGMRWEIVNSLLEEFGVDELRIVEVGVFAGHFSKFLLEKFPKLQLIGIDPYIGTDETFPGDYSQTLDPAVAYGNAAAIYEESGKGRATLWATTSVEAVKNVPDKSLHAVFIDGCHFYHCVAEDLKLWLPKVIPGGLVLGHDFSPQWPGVVRAVWENRPRKQVSVAMDWMYWWQVDDEPVPTSPAV